MLSKIIFDDISFERFATRRSRVILCEHHAPHFGHYYWNVLTGWDEIVRSVDGKPLLGVQWSDQGFGPLASDLWPDRISVSDAGPMAPGIAFERLAADRGWLPVALGADRVSRDLASAVQCFAQAGRSSEIEAWFDTQATQRRAVVALSLRLGNRQWCGQGAGYLALARQIAARLGAVAFVIDGMSIDTPKTQSHALLPFDSEIAMADDLVRGISSFAPCASVVNRAATDALFAAYRCHYFFAPAGSGLVKFLWLANRNGVVFSNPEVLAGESAHARAVRVFETYREGGTAARWLAADKVVDRGNRSRRGNASADFDLDWTNLLTEAEDDLEAIARRFRSDIGPTSAKPGTAS